MATPSAPARHSSDRRSRFPRDRTRSGERIAFPEFQTKAGMDRIRAEMLAHELREIRGQTPHL